PVIVLFVIPLGQSRQRLALDLCTQYFGEEMRDARNVGWRHFVTEQGQLPPARRAERLGHFLDYLSDPEVHRSVDPATDAVYQKASRVLDFFALVNGCLARGAADPEITRDFLLFYYLWWRDEIMDPLRGARRIAADHPKVRFCLGPWGSGRYRPPINRPHAGAVDDTLGPVPLAGVVQLLEQHRVDLVPGAVGRQSRSRRQQDMPDPPFSSAGRSSHGS